MLRRIKDIRSVILIIDCIFNVFSFIFYVHVQLEYRDNIYHPLTPSHLNSTWFFKALAKDHYMNIKQIYDNIYLIWDKLDDSFF